jgi:hypothetical protein
MKRFIRVRFVGAAQLFSLLALWGAVGHAQVDTIDPNPLLPLDVGGSLTSRGFSDSRFLMGRTSSRDPNPAETLLRSIDGTNYGRATGHSLFSRSTRARATTADGQRRRLSFDPQTTNIDASRLRSDRERRRNDPNQAVDLRRAASRSAAPTSERHVSIGTPRAPRITRKNDLRKGGK